MNFIIKGVLKQFAGKKAYQNLFLKLHRFALKGMNIGLGNPIETSGEINALQYAAKKLSAVANPVLFDVGANQSHYTKALLNVFNQGTIYAFEPSVTTFKVYQQNTSHLSNVHAFNFGFGNEEKNLTLYTDKDGSGLASVYQRNLDHLNIHMNQTEEITIRTLDNVCHEQGIKHIHFLKIDVEGHEISVLQGAEKMLTNQNIDFIQFEFGGCNIDSRTYFRDFFTLLNPNFSIHRILTNGLEEIKHYSEIFENFSMTNYLAINRINQL